MGQPRSVQLVKPKPGGGIKLRLITDLLRSRGNEFLLAADVRPAQEGEAGFSSGALLQEVKKGPVTIIESQYP